jgi:hypothetical protein
MSVAMAMAMAMAIEGLIRKKFFFLRGLDCYFGFTFILSIWRLSFFYYYYLFLRCNSRIWRPLAGEMPRLGA